MFAEAEDTSLSLGRLWIILYHIVHTEARLFIHSYPRFYAFNPSAAKGEVTRLFYRVELRGPETLEEQNIKVCRETVTRRGNDFIRAIVNVPLNIFECKRLFKRDLKEMSYYLEIIIKILKDPFF